MPLETIVVEEQYALDYLAPIRTSNNEATLNYGLLYILRKEYLISEGFIVAPDDTNTLDAMYESIFRNRQLEHYTDFIHSYIGERTRNNLNIQINILWNSLPSIHASYLENVPAPENGLTLRPSSHGLIDEAHNLNVKYKNCFGTINDKIVYIQSFRLDPDRKVMIEYYPQGSGKNIREEYDPTKHKFIPPILGWTIFGKACIYLEHTPGGFLRGFGRENIRISAAIDNFKPVPRPNNFISMDYTVAEAALNRKFMSLEEGVQNKLPFIIVDQELMLYTSSVENNKYYAALGNIVVGSYIVNKQFVKLKPEYTQLKPLIEKVLPYEIK